MNEVDAKDIDSQLTRIGLGAWAMGGPYEFGWGPVDDDRSVATIHAAQEAGIGWVDTAPAYGLGHSEEIVGQALRKSSASDPIAVFTKCGRVWDPAAPEKVRTDLRPASIEAECVASLRRLGVDHIAGYQIHRPDPKSEVPLEESWEALANLADAGKVRWIGLCNVSLGQYHACSAVRHVDTVQVGLNLFRPADESLLEACRANGTRVLAFSPLASGLLSGHFDKSRLAADDWRARSPRFDGEELAAKLTRVDEMAALAGQAGCSVAELAVAWVLHQKCVDAAIVGARRPEQIDDWINASVREVGPAVLSAIGQLRID
ncbi:aldo/keto reductase [Amycolatopsis minnesotensis]|uniref:Aldo/keto reductase n=1 Tax=Amycolatopsis minnesotensis TaxID=337894 RepID=A0ABN2PX90_9PSEU